MPAKAKVTKEMIYQNKCSKIAEKKNPIIFSIPIRCFATYFANIFCFSQP